MKTSEILPYKFIERHFSYNETDYKVVLTAELYPVDEGLDFTGRYLGLLISSKKGTKSFELEPDEHLRWISEPKGMDPDIIDELDKIIQELRGSKKMV